MFLNGRRAAGAEVVLPAVDTDRDYTCRDLESNVCIFGMYDPGPTTTAGARPRRFLRRLVEPSELHTLQAR